MKKPETAAPPGRPEARGAFATPLREKKQELVRSALRDAALDLFLERGFEAVRVEEIAERAGVSRRTFFRYFASKDDLMAQGVDEFREVVRRVAEGSPRNARPLELFRKIAAEVARISAAAPRSRDVVRIILVSPGARMAQMTRVAAVEDVLENAFLSRCRGREERKAARIFAAMTLAAVGAILREWCLSDGAAVERIAEQVLGAFGRSLAGGAAGGRGEREFL